MKNKYYLYSMLAAALTLGSCDYNEEHFPGYDESTEITHVVSHEGDFTGIYPTEGYFTLRQTDEDTENSDRNTIKEALVEMLTEMYPYCDAGSSAKVNIKIGVITPGTEDPEANDEYTLVDADYEALGEEPAEHHNFAYNMDVDAYLVQFCNMRYADATEGTIVKLTYEYYANYTTTNVTVFYRKTADSWEEFVNFEPDMTYELQAEDYDLLGTGYGEPGDYDNFTYNMSQEQIDFYLAEVAERKYGYLGEGATVQLTYAYYSNRTTTNVTVVFKKTAEGWISFDPTESTTTITDMVSVLKFDGSAWELTNLISGIERLTLSNTEYTLMVDWVNENKPKFMSTQGNYEEYYFGASAKYNNINNRYSTWKNYYNVEGYLDGLKDAEIQDVMDRRLAEEAFPQIVLPAMVANPNPDMSYEVIYKIYGGRGDGNYSLSFYYNAEENKYEWDGLSPVSK